MSAVQRRQLLEGLAVLRDNLQATPAPPDRTAKRKRSDVR